MKCLLIFLTILLGSSQVQAACPLPDARIALHEFPPFYFKASDGSAQGKLVQLITQVMTRLGCQWSSEFLPVPRLLANISNGSSDIAMIIRHPQLENRAYYGNVPVGELVLKLFHQPDQAPISDLTAIPKGSRVIVRRGYGFSGLINHLLRPESGLQLVLAESHQQAVEQLRDRQGEYLLNYDGPTTELLERNGMYHITGEQVATWPIYLLLSGRINDGQSLISQLDATAQAILAETQ